MRFLIDKDGVFYLTTGTLLEYDPAAAKGHPHKEKGVAEVAAEFKRIKDSPNTHYNAVQITTASFSPLNTGSS
ncbi:MAG TPA: hypothetical protein VGX37_11960 [Allosphingosinicella sp.]|jgi:hypothetical protein|nr:hypothetical protein [Allosphingosinicella sp.]